MSENCGVATEVQYDFLKKNKGLMGSPLFWRVGGNGTTKAGMKLNWQLNLGDRFWWTWKGTMPLNKNTNFTISERLCLKNMLMDPKNADYSMGLAMEFKM